MTARSEPALARCSVSVVERKRVYPFNLALQGHTLALCPRRYLMSRLKLAFLFTAFTFFLLAISYPAQAQTHNSNTIYACYQKNSGELRKVSGPGQCRNSETEISWSISGVPGPQGAPGQSVTVASAPPGANCANGGLMLTDSSGNHFLCNGAPGAKGDQGEPGTPGASPVVTAEAAGANCASGGLKVTDASGAVSYVCNGSPGASGGSNLFITRTKSFNVPPDTTPTQIGVLNLPPGNYLVSAKATVRNFSANSPHMFCQFSVNDVFDGDSDIDMTVPVKGDTPFGTTQAYSLPSGGQVQFMCGQQTPLDPHTFQPLFTPQAILIFSGVLWATPVSAINVQ